jgi:Icc-related predicted phosphoesterase
MIIDCISDLHGEHPHLTGGDVLIIAGDCTTNDKVPAWDRFFRWLHSQKYKHKIIIAGNHDNFCMQWPASNDTLYELLDKPELSFLCDSGIEIEGVKFWGSPWTLKFPGINPHCCAFTLDNDDELKQKWDLIPDDIDVLITHMPPFGIFDRTKRNEHVGSLSLRMNNLLCENLKLHVFGHIHECGGNILHEGNKKLVNASIMDENYEPVNKPARIIL